MPHLAGFARHLPTSCWFAASAALVSTLAFAVAWVRPTLLPLFVPIAFAAVLALGLSRFPRPKIAPLALAAFLPYFALYLIYALAPETGPDAMTYHLSIPAQWLRSGDFFAPAGHYEVMPHGMELLFTAAGHSAKLVHFAFFVASIPLMLAASRKLGFDGWPAACLYFMIPVAGVCATSAYVDAALAFFALAAFYFLLEDWPGWAGAMAGFCYAVKMTGIVAGPAVVAFLLLRKRWRAGALAAATCFAMMLPWIARAWWMTGNPAAPLLNDWFPSPFFHPGTEEALKQYVGSYGVVWREMALELTLGGGRTNGLLGPAMLLAPLGLLALRKGAGRALWLAAAVASLPWWINHGTRFLLPALPFVCLAMALSLPRPVAWIVVAGQGIACWPTVMDRWADPAAWRLKDPPVAAAFRQESAEDYLKRASPEYRIADFLRRNTKEGDRILDLVGVASAYVDRPVFSQWQYASAERAADALRVAAFADRGAYRQLQALWTPRKLAALRVELTGSGAESWALQEIELLRAGAAIHPARSWELDAEPNPWETPLLFDRNPASRWQSWRKAETGMYLEAAFPERLDCDGIRILGWRDDSAPVRILGREAAGPWVRLSGSPDRRAAPALSLRRWATRFVQREGFVWIAAHSSESPAGDSPWGRLGRQLVEHPADWGFRVIGSEGGVALLSLESGPPAGLVH